MNRYIRLDTMWDASQWLAPLSSECRLCWVLLLCYVRGHGTCGRAKALDPERAARMWYVGEESVRQLFLAAEAHGALRIEDSDWVVDKWDRYQEPDKEELRLQRKAYKREWDRSHAETRHRSGLKRNLNPTNPTKPDKPDRTRHDLGPDLNLNPTKPDRTRQNPTQKVSPPPSPSSPQHSLSPPISPTPTKITPTTPQGGFDSLMIPESVRVLNIEEELRDWDKHRRQKRTTMTPLAWDRLFKRLASMGAARAKAAINHSIENGYTGVFEPTSRNGQATKPEPVEYQYTKEELRRMFE